MLVNKRVKLVENYEPDIFGKRESVASATTSYGYSSNPAAPSRPNPTNIKVIGVGGGGGNAK